MRLTFALLYAGAALLTNVECCAVDNDGDGWNECCSGESPTAGTCDCDDTDPNVHPGAEEACNGLDDNCDGVVPEDETTTAYEDVDADGWGSNETDLVCNLQGSALVPGDCDDSDAAVHPDAEEVCDEDDVDEDCDELVDDDDPGVDPDTYHIYYEDQDRDTWGSSVRMDSCDMDPNQSSRTGDCDDTRSSVYPSAVEVCGDGIDNDCDGTVDEGFDTDGDGYKTCVTSTAADCDDGDSSIHPGASEICNGVDDDCDGSVDEGLDADQDGYTTCSGDCNDSNALIKPGADDSICNGIDEDCDGNPDDGNIPRNNPICGCTNGNYYQICIDGSLICPPQYDLNEDGDAYSTCEGDCNDKNAFIYPGAAETVGNGVDESCDGKEICYSDPDDDGYLTSSPSTLTSTDTDCADTNEGMNTDPWTDCRENDPISYPGAAEICDGIDNDCDGTTGDEGADDDQDGYKPCLQGDCNDTDASVYPGAPELCDGKDNNCDGALPEDLDLDGFTTCTSSGNAFDCDDDNAQINACFGSAIFGKSTFAK